MTTKEILQQALNKFGPNGENWVNRMPNDRPEHCTVTATYVFGHNYAKAWDVLYDVIGNNMVSLGHWNDTHTWPEVKAAFERAIEAAQ